MRERTEILLAAPTGTEILRRLLEFKKQSDSKYSLTFIAGRLNLSSKGHVADLLSGRRNISPKLWQALMQLLGIEGLEKEYCELLLMIEKRIAKDEVIEDEVYRKLESLRKTLAGRLTTYSDRVVSDQMVLEVHAVFGLYKNRPTRQQLLQFFGKAQFLAVDRAIHVLQSEGIVGREGENFVLKENAQHISILGTGDQKEKIFEFIKAGMDQSKAAIHEWADQKSLATFRSSLLCVKQADYEKRLKILLEELIRAQNEMGSTDGDMLVRFDLQVYPLGRKEPG